MRPPNAKKEKAVSLAAATGEETFFGLLYCIGWKNRCGFYKNLIFHKIVPYNPTVLSGYKNAGLSSGKKQTFYNIAVSRIFNW